MSALSPTRESEFSCSHCEQPIPFAGAHYQVYFYVRQLEGNWIDIHYAQSIAALCPRCSLDFDLTKLDVPNAEGWYTDEPFDGTLTHDCQCALCRREFVEGEQFQAAVIDPMDFANDQNEPTVTISLCQPCATKRALRYAEPPSNAYPPYCYQCGTYTGYTGGYSDQRIFYVAHPSVRPSTLSGEKVRVCGECFFEELDD